MLPTSLVETEQNSNMVHVATVIDQIAPTSKGVVVVNPLGLGDKNEIWEAAKRYQMMIPSFAELSLVECSLVAQVAFKMRLNPFAGEIYAFKSAQSKKEGNEWVKVEKLLLVIGYKAMIRWCKRQCDYDAIYHEMTKQEKEAEGLADNCIAFTCEITRHDTIGRVQFLVNNGMSVSEALQRVATKAIGVVLYGDMFTAKDSKPIPCPKGWSWKQSARKRALKNALMMAYSLPSIDELDEGAFDYDGYDEEDPFSQQQAAIKKNNTLAIEDRKLEMIKRVNVLRGEVEEGIN